MMDIGLTGTYAWDRKQYRNVQKNVLLRQAALLLIEIVTTVTTTKNAPT